MSKVHTAVKVREDDSLVLPAFIMRGMGYEPGEEVPVTTPTDQYICDCDANSLFVSRVCGDAGCAGYTSEGPDLNLPARHVGRRRPSPWARISQCWRRTAP